MLGGQRGQELLAIRILRHPINVPMRIVEQTGANRVHRQSTSVARWSRVRRRSRSVPVGMATKSVAPTARESLEVRGDGCLVADDGDVGGTFGAFRVEHGAVHGQIAVARELFTGGGATVGLVVGDDGRERDDHTRIGTPRRARGVVEQWNNLPLERDRARAPRDRAVGHTTCEREHPRLQRGEQQRGRGRVRAARAARARRRSRRRRRLRHPATAAPVRRGIRACAAPDGRTTARTSARWSRDARARCRAAAAIRWPHSR